MSVLITLDDYSYLPTYMRFAVLNISRRFSIYHSKELLVIELNSGMSVETPLNALR